jgi:hypothetical protein
MKFLNVMNVIKKMLFSGALTLVSSLLVFGAGGSARAFRPGKKAKIRGVIISKTNDALKLRADDKSIAIIDLTRDTRIELEGTWGERDPLDARTLIPGLRIEAKGKGNEDGQLVAEEVSFDRESMRVSWETAPRVPRPVARATPLDDPMAALGNRAERMETNQSHW